MKLNSALQNADTDLQIGMQTHYSSGAITGLEGTCWSATIWSQMSLHQRRTRRMSWILVQHHIKIVTVTDVVPVTRKGLAGCTFKHQ